MEATCYVIESKQDMYVIILQDGRARIIVWCDGWGYVMQNVK